jgi:acyl dehydratase
MSKAVNSEISNNILNFSLTDHKKMKTDIKVGDKAFMSKVFTKEDVIKYSEISNDTNPIHLDEVSATSTVFGGRVVHGIFVASLFSALIGNELPGNGSIYLGQTLNFKAPVFIGDQVTASVEIISIRKDKPIATLRTICTDHQGKIAIEGEAVIKYM